MAKSGRGNSTRVGGRDLSQKVKTARGRKISSTRWLQRQLNDPYVREAKKRGLRSRAAFKLMEMDDRFHFLKPGSRVIDLGAAPGGWTQVAVERVKAPDRGRVVALDINAMEPIPGAQILICDFLATDAPEQLKNALNGPADVVLSDMAEPATGHTATDHLRIMGLCEAALEFAAEVLAPGGVFLAKVLKGGTEHALLTRMKRDFKSVKHVKPPASRADSAETYVIAQGFRA
ncbi:MAG: RlmE family RNA methyltransferase [Rhodospirillales bacterium]|nr:RlmE family RNA methyltransferase [Rhodospirillales bacterium]